MQHPGETAARPTSRQATTACFDGPSAAAAELWLRRGILLARLLRPGRRPPGRPVTWTRTDPTPAR